MKIAAFVLTIISMALNITFRFVFAIYSLVVGDPIFFMLCFIGCALTSVFGSFAIYYINKNKKLIWVGVCNLIFVSLIGGILYLCWEGETETKDEKTTALSPKNPENVTNEMDVSEILLKLNKLYEGGIISKEEYEEKRKKYIDLL
ncbi:MAG TPA: hypothetical protein DDW18_01690 [Firmicutes bacterium]|nr:hypothetical protein [Bacillota bacterium]HBN00926.1 hypothetical protein [Bacillota bacterium]